MFLRPYQGCAIVLWEIFTQFRAGRVTANFNQVPVGQWASLGFLRLAPTSVARTLLVCHIYNQSARVARLMETIKNRQFHKLLSGFYCPFSILDIRTNCWAQGELDMLSSVHETITVPR